MNFKKLAIFASTLLVAVAFSGCAKKPRRPNPIDTVTGPGSGSGYRGGDYVSPEAIAGDTTFGDGTQLEGRNFGNGSGEDLAARGRRGILESVFFNFDSASIQPQERGKLTRASEYLNANPRAKLVLEGHCDWRGTAEYNLALGDRRAKSVQQFLATLKISPDRLVTLSKGDLKASEGAGSAQMTKDRRVELIVVD